MRKKSDFMITKNDELKAVYSTDLDVFLERIGKKHAFDTSTLFCRYCKDVISKENLYAFIPVDRDIQLCCNRPECIDSLIEEANNDTSRSNL